MTEPDDDCHAADEQLMADLARLVAERDPVPPHLPGMARESFTWRTIDAELAELVADSLRPGEATLLRGSATAPLVDPPAATPVAPLAPVGKLTQRERDDALWRCLEEISPCCRTLLRTLLADPPPSYTEVAAALDMPIGSIGPTRRRCLQDLRRRMQEVGVSA